MDSISVEIERIEAIPTVGPDMHMAFVRITANCQFGQIWSGQSIDLIVRFPYPRSSEVSLEEMTIRVAEHRLRSALEAIECQTAEQLLQPPIDPWKK